MWWMRTVGPQEGWEDPTRGLTLGRHPFPAGPSLQGGFHWSRPHCPETQPGLSEGSWEPQESKHLDVLLSASAHPTGPLRPPSNLCLRSPSDLWITSSNLPWVVLPRLNPLVIAFGLVALIPWAPNIPGKAHGQPPVSCWGPAARGSELGTPGSA